MKCIILMSADDVMWLGRLGMFFDARYKLRRIDETQRDEKPYECDRHVDHGHRVDRLRSAHTGCEHCVIERDDQRLRVGTRRQESQLEQPDGAHEYEQ